jgi:hypothetical protein
VRIDEAERIRKAEAERLRLEEVERQRLAKEKADADAREIAELKAKLKAQEDEAARIAAEEKARQERLDAIEKARETKPEVVSETKLQVVQGVAVDNHDQSEGAPAVLIVDAVSPKSDPVTTPETPIPSIIPTDPIDRETFLAGAKAAFGMAKREFPDITPAQWRDCWRRFQEM